MSLKTKRLPIAVLLLLLPGAADSQEKPGRLPPSEATTVLVDVVVRDKKGQPAGLVASDFEVLEDGQPQRVTQSSRSGALHRTSQAKSEGARGTTGAAHV